MPTRSGFAKSKRWRSGSAISWRTRIIWRQRSWKIPTRTRELEVLRRRPEGAGEKRSLLFPPKMRSLWKFIFCLTFNINKLASVTASLIFGFCLILSSFFSISFLSPATQFEKITPKLEVLLLRKKFVFLPKQVANKLEKNNHSLDNIHPPVLNFCSLIFRLIFCKFDITLPLL